MKEMQRGTALHLLRLVKRGYATDAYKTKDKAPVSGPVWPLLTPLVDAGLIVMDESTAPISAKPPHELLRGWASLTDAGNDALAFAEAFPS